MLEPKAKKRILITGSSGMLGRALCRELSDKYEVIELDICRNQKPETRNQINNFIEADITQRNETIEKVIKQKPDLVIHTAAYTDVGGCEENSERAHRVNALGTQNVAQACKDSQCLLIYISTDFVFDGEKKSAYIEEDPPNPINIYGKSKLVGERFVQSQSILKESIIVRSSWLFGKGGRNFVDALIRKAQNEKRIEVVNDEFGSPTYAKDLAQAISRLIGLTERPSSIYHITNSGSCSWYEFAQAVKEIANLDAEIVPVSSNQYHSPARRPKMSVLENRRYREATGGNLRHWKEALKEYLLG